MLFYNLFHFPLQEVESAGVSDDVGEAAQTYLDRSDVVLVTKLRCKVTGKVITVGNIHVVWDWMKCPDVQCVQVREVHVPSC